MAKADRNPTKAGAAQRSRPEGGKAKARQILAERAEELEPESTEGIEDEPRTIEEANAQRSKGPTASKSATKKADKAKEKAPKLTPEQRRAKRDAEDKAARANGGVARTASGKVTARGLPCLCGCGSATVTEEARFISGHDAQFRSRVLKGEQTIDSPESKLIRPFYEAGEVVAGFGFEGGELVDLHAGAGE